MLWLSSEIDKIDSIHHDEINWNVCEQINRLFLCCCLRKKMENGKVLKCLTTKRRPQGGLEKCFSQSKKIFRPFLPFSNRTFPAFHLTMLSWHSQQDRDEGESLESFFPLFFKASNFSELFYPHGKCINLQSDTFINATSNKCRLAWPRNWAWVCF
jgi:hypothetical protein